MKWTWGKVVFLIWVLIAIAIALCAGLVVNSGLSDAKIQTSTVVVLSFVSGAVVFILEAIGTLLLLGSLPDNDPIQEEEDEE